jgi:ATP-binding cassette subfamily F protein uup
MERLGAWDYESQAKQVLGALGIDDLEQVISSLSGGQKRRVALAQVLLSQPDFMILDEPTNHLDLDMIEWLEQYLLKSAMTLLMVTHDRYYLENICDEIIELADETMYRYKGNFSYYLEKKAEREEQQAASVERARNTYRKELEWVRTSPKARTTKSKSRIDRFEDVQNAARGKKEEKELQAGINMERLGGKIVEYHRVRKSFGKKVIFNGLDYVFRRAERVGVVGRNGCGKTTFLELMTGKIEPDGGKIVIGDTVVFGYYTQEGIKLKPGMRIIEAVREIAEVVPLKGGQKLTAAELLERFLFPRKRHFEYIEKLSGGEKKRLYLLTILMKNPNFLILDEPTNDLDIFTLSALEEYLEQFNGCLVVVSHDRYFMDKLVEHVLWFKGDGTVRDIPGNYTLYREQMLNEEKREAEDRKTANIKIEKQKEEKPKIKLSFKEKFELDQIEKDLPVLENRKAELESLIGGGTSDHEQLLKWTRELGDISAELEAKGDRWLELTELAGG